MSSVYTTENIKEKRFYSFNRSTILHVCMCGAAEDETTLALIVATNKRMKIEVKDLGILDQYNRVDIKQMVHYIHLSCQVYIEKIIKGHTWITEDMHTSRFSLPMDAEAKFSQQMEEVVAPEDHK